MRLTFATLSCLLLLLPVPPARASTPACRADAHVHLVDFFQEGDGIDALIEAMDAGGIDRALVMGIPVAKVWHEDAPKRPRYYQGDEAPVYWYSATDAIVASEVAKLPPDERRRIHPFLSGVNPNDKNATLHVRRMLEMYPEVFEGIGEIVTRHDDLTALLPGEAPRANSEAMSRIYRLAAEFDLPVLLHSNLTSVREREPLYAEELERALAAHPGTRFIWAHAGASAEIHRTQGPMPFLRATLERLLDRYDNLWVDLSWVVLDPYLLDDRGEAERTWIELIEAHADRFLIGSDVVGRFDSMQEKLGEFDRLLAALSHDTASRLACQNLEAILPQNRVRTADAVQP